MILSVYHDPWLETRRKGTIICPNAIKPWLCLPLILLTCSTCSHLEELSLPVASAALGVVSNNQENVYATITFLWLLEQSCMLQLCG